MEYGLIGEHLPHSFSKIIHEKLAHYQYDMLELAPDEVDSFMRKKDFKGINVTIPYKERVIPYLDEISDRARRIGAVNTIINRDGRLCGHNTDYFGIRELLRLNQGASIICRVSRTGKDGAITYEEMYEKHTDAEVIINTTPCGMYPDIDACPVDLDKFRSLRGVIDVVYNPLRTVLVLEAQKRGIPATGGLYMLVIQAIYAAEIFTGRQFDRETADLVYQEVLNSKRSIVLTGMSMSGKTTLGSLLSGKLGRRVVDTDQMVIKKEQRQITDIFAKDGEPYFRDVESEMVRSLATENGLIIATGGGVVLREENVDALKKNGHIVFLDRPLEQILPTDDRPLANTRDKVTALFTKRYPTYRATCDGFVPNDMTPEEGAERILRVLKYRV